MTFDIEKSHQKYEARTANIFISYGEGLFEDKSKSFVIAPVLFRGCGGKVLFPWHPNYLK